jgi:hypothetical protein
MPAATVALVIDIAVLSERFKRFGATSASRAPLYQRLSERIAADPSVLAILQSASAEQAVPVLLFAAVHHLLLSPEGSGDELADWYPTLAHQAREDDGYPAFQAFVYAHTDQLRRLVATRHTQTNEVGRSALMLPALGLIEHETGAPLSLIEVGASAGLNLLIDRYSYHYAPGGNVAGPSAVRLECALRGPVPIPIDVPHIAGAVGLDAQPVDVTDPDGIRWLKACVWPDQPDRFRRLDQALSVARATPPVVHLGDAVNDLAPLLHAANGHGHPVIVTSWVLSYLTEERQRAFVATLDLLSTEMDLSWVSLESPAQTPGLPIPARHPDEDLTVLALTRWRGGRRSVHRLATCHPHGYWMHWETGIL